MIQKPRSHFQLLYRKILLELEIKSENDREMTRRKLGSFLKHLNKSWEIWVKMNYFVTSQMMKVKKKTLSLLRAHSWLSVALLMNNLVDSWENWHVTPWSIVSTSFIFSSTTSCISDDHHHNENETRFFLAQVKFLSSWEILGWWIWQC